MTLNKEIEMSNVFTFVMYDNSNDNERTEKQFEANWLPDVVARFADFLRGCGYVFDDIELVNLDVKDDKDSDDWDDWAVRKDEESSEDE